MRWRYGFLALAAFVAGVALRGVLSEEPVHEAQQGVSVETVGVAGDERKLDPETLLLLDRVERLVGIARWSTGGRRMTWCRG